jgi:hypothetical protein
MNEPKPLASLSPTLLARKGGAKPAMRRQMHYPDSLARSVEDDLGWNDMGEEDHVESGIEHTISAAPVPLGLSPIDSVPSGEVVPIKAQVELPVEPAKPAIVYHQEAVAEAIAQVIAGPTKMRRSALDSGRRAAFTLRMDAERHLKLRLACTIRNRSAQQLVTEALDRLIDELPDLATLAAQVAERR